MLLRFVLAEVVQREGVVTWIFHACRFGVEQEQLLEDYLGFGSACG